MRKRQETGDKTQKKGDKRRGPETGDKIQKTKRQKTGNW